MAIRPWEEIAAAKQKQRMERIPKKWIIPTDILPDESAHDVQDCTHSSGFFTDEELVITESTATEVVKNIASGKWKSKEGIEAVCKRGSVAQQLINCLTEIYFQEAIKRAEELDEYLAREGKHFKDQFQLKGTDTSVEYISWTNKPATEDSTLAELLCKAGALPFVKTNVPATLMMGESVNNVFGRTRNPRNRELTTDGSSGGESALVTSRGSFIGVGTDIEAVRSCAGPMWRSASDIRLFMSSLAAQEPWLYDLQSVPIPWRKEQEVLPRKLCFGFATGDGKVSATPPLRRAVEITKKALLEAGHEWIEFVPEEHLEAADIITKMWSADGGQEFQRDTNASGEPLHPQLEFWLGHSAEAKQMSVFETWQNQHRRAVLATKWMERWQATRLVTSTGRPIDGLIMPSFETNVTEDGSPKNHENALVGFAVIARRLEEEKVVAMLGLISQALKAPLNGTEEARFG
ncbi:amidase [Halenospora varia]|nr:amidase [Halenospora varia]